MVLQSEFVAHWARDRRLAFVGDGDAISVCAAYLHAREILSYGPSRITVFDFDERIVGAVNRFADQERLENLEARLFNCVDPLLTEIGKYDCFYTNPPWGASNGGESVILFARRGMELIAYEGEGLVVIADCDPHLPWTEETLANVQRFGSESGFYVSRMMARMHEYHLDDNPELRSCNLILKSKPGNGREFDSEPADGELLKNFYGAGAHPTVRYVREKDRINYGKAHSDEYWFEEFEGESDD